MPQDAATRWVALLEERADLSADIAALGAVRLASKRFQDALGEDSLDCHLVVESFPEIGDVRVKLGLHTEPPEEPTFTVNVAWEDLETMFREQQTPQSLFLAGKLRLGGDYSKALQLAMQLMQQPL
jgi:hypothetical protein